MSFPYYIIYILHFVRHLSVNRSTLRKYSEENAKRRYIDPHILFVVYVGTNKRLMKTPRVEKKKIFEFMWSSAVRITLYYDDVYLENIRYLNI